MSPRHAWLAVAAGSLSLAAGAGLPAVAAQSGPVTVVLVHGAWADGLSWNRVIPLLQAKGIPVVAVQNPLTSLADDVSATQRALADIKGPVVLVGHSWAGSVITQAGGDPKVAALVYVAAFANKEGQSGADLIGAYPKAPVLGKIIDDGHGFLTLSAKGFAENVAHDLPPSEARILAATQGPLGAGAFGDKVTVVAWRTKACWYVISANDRAISPQVERDLARQMHAKTAVVAASHMSLLSHPHEVAAVIQDAVAVTRRGTH